MTRQPISTDRKEQIISRLKELENKPVSTLTASEMQEYNELINELNADYYI